MRVVIYRYKRTTKILLSDICFPQHNDRNSVCLCNKYTVYYNNRFALITYLIVLFFSIEPIEISKTKECCKKCGVSIEKSRIDFHMRNVHGLVEQCQSCHTYFDTHDQLLDHAISCHSPVENPSSHLVDLFVDNACKVCGHFVEPTNKLEHLRVYHGYIAMCEICPKYFKSREGYGHHMMMFHSDQSLSHPCSKCGKKFQTPSLLKRHMKIHSSSRPFVCKVCTMAFKFNWVLQNHLKRHEQGS